MRKIIVIFFVLSYWQNLFSQTVIGVVKDSSGAAIRNAIVTDVETQNKTRTDKDGSFSIAVPANRFVTIEISHNSFRSYSANLILKDGETQVLNVVLNDAELGVVEVRDRFKSGMENISPIPFQALPTMRGNFEDFIKLVGIGVSSNNELSSQYSVRGGNFDENLIYVNDIEIYRPFLVRAGQQEGLSFIHSDLVSGIAFSAGGFDARYGDKMSSVLDITYRRPTKFNGSAQASFMGGNLHLEGVSKNQKLRWLVGSRYQANSYILGGLQTKGEYKPVFADAQFLVTYDITENWRMELLGHLSLNSYRFLPVNRETSFGTITNALRFTVYFDGQEVNSFNTATGAASFVYQKREHTTYKIITSFFRSDEQENFDVMGQYFIGELDNNLGSDNFGEVAFNRGIGTFINHARNRLQAQVANVGFKASTRKYNNHHLEWGGRVQFVQINDRLSEWQMIDSAGFSIPQNPPNEIKLYEVIKGSASLMSGRAEAYLQDTWRRVSEKVITFNDSTFKSEAIWNLVYGLRANYWTLNEQILFSPRARISYRPRWYTVQNDSVLRRGGELRLAGGVYYQPPFYRELRGYFGDINNSVKAQRSFHLISGLDYVFNKWDRPFKFTTELYFKYMDFLNPYKVDNVRIRYFADNNAIGYAAGLDLKLNGELVEGVESYFKASVMQTKENLLDDYYYNFFNSDGEQIFFGFTTNDSVVDSLRIEPGFIRRPTDQRFSFGMYLQDKMPGLPALKVHLAFLFGTGLPHGPPGMDRYKDVLRTTAYRRVDIGFSYNLLEDKNRLRSGSWLRKLDDFMISLEVFNLLGLNNTISYTWIKDVEGLQWAIPNFLTPRRINLKISVKF